MGNYLSNDIVTEHFQHLIVPLAFSVVLGNPLFDPFIPISNAEYLNVLVFVIIGSVL